MKIKPHHFEELEDDIDDNGKIESQWADVCRSCSEKLDNRFKYNIQDHAYGADPEDSGVDFDIDGDVPNGMWCLVDNCKHLADFYVTFFK